MKAQTVHYSRTVSDHSYNNQRIGITLELDDGDTAGKVIEEARRWVDHHIGVNHATKENLEQMMGRLEKEMNQCREVLAAPPVEDGFPF